MSFASLPNEIVYYIFDFLAAFDILRVFARLNRRYDDLIKFHIQRLDLTDDWQGDHHQLQCICGFIQKIKIDQRHLNYLFNYQFSQLHSLNLLNIFDWQNVIARTNLKNLRLWLKEYIHLDEVLIPQTVIRFSVNVLMNANAFHSNLIHLTLCVRSISHLIKIVERTPNIQYLNVTLWPYHMSTNEEPSLISNFRRLMALQNLSFTVMYTRNDGKLSFTLNSGTLNVSLNRIHICG